MKVSVLTLGCRVNQSESDMIEGNLKKLGWSAVNLAESPDYCVINTCTVTAKSDYQSRQFIRRATRSGAKVIVTGCYSQLNQEEVKNIPGVYRIVQNSNKYHIIKMLSKYNAGYTFSKVNRSRPYLKIQDGCNHACSYCSVPFARGGSVSIPVTEVIRQAVAIDVAGFHEIVITGIHLGSYGYDLKPKSKLSDLLKIILNKTKIKRIRLSSIGIKDIDNELIELFRDERICRHLHLPLQSGSDDILKLMNRMYSAKDYITTVEKIIKKAPGLAIGTDVITGFPGESEKDYLETIQLLDNLPITYIHAFPFSPRPRTLAAKMANQKDSAVKDERVKELKALSNRKKKAYMLTQIDKTLDVIIEGHGSDNTSTGTSSNYLKVKIPTNICSAGAFVRVRISSIVEDKCLRGELVEDIQLNDFK
jgi:threonylcarbamoyladenosine tRNA methylthiotransferase MtaB